MELPGGERGRQRPSLTRAIKGWGLVLALAVDTRAACRDGSQAQSWGWGGRGQWGRGTWRQLGAANGSLFLAGCRWRSPRRNSLSQRWIRNKKKEKDADTQRHCHAGEASLFYSARLITCVWFNLPSTRLSPSNDSLHSARDTFGLLWVLLLLCLFVCCLFYCCCD